VRRSRSRPCRDERTASKASSAAASRSTPWRRRSRAKPIFNRRFAISSIGEHNAISVVCQSYLPAQQLGGVLWSLRRRVFLPVLLLQDTKAARLRPGGGACHGTGEAQGGFGGWP
jgi:hypothetical protein